MKFTTLLFSILTIAAAPFAAQAGDMSIPLNPEMEAAQMSRIAKEESAVSQCIQSLNKPTYSAFTCISDKEKSLKIPYHYIYPDLTDIQDRLIADADALSQQWVDRSFLVGNGTDTAEKKATFSETDLPQLIAVEIDFDELLHRKKDLLMKVRPTVAKQIGSQAGMWDSFVYSEKALQGRLKQ